MYFLLLLSNFLKTSWDTCSHEFTLVYNENSDDITYNHFLSLLSFSFLLTTRLWVYKECMMQEQGALGVPLKRKDLKNKVAFSTQGDRLIQSPKLSNQHMSFFWPLGLPILWHWSLHNAQCGTPIHEGYRSLGEGGWHMTPKFSHMPTHLFFKKWTKTNTWNLSLNWCGWCICLPEALEFDIGCQRMISFWICGSMDWFSKQRTSFK